MARPIKREHHELANQFIKGLCEDRICNPSCQIILNVHQKELSSMDVKNAVFKMGWPLREDVETPVVPISVRG